MHGNEQGTPNGSRRKTSKVVTLNMNIRSNVAWILCNAEWTYGKINALMGLAFAHDVDAAIVSELEGQAHHAIKCVSLPLQLYLQSFLLPFGWEEEGGILFSPKESCLNGGDLIALIENSRKSFYQSGEKVEQPS